MSKNKYRKFRKLFDRYKVFLIIGMITFFGCLLASLLLYHYIEDQHSVYYKLAEYLMDTSQTILGAGLIGGGIGGGINFIYEEFRKEEEDVKDRLKSIREGREKRKQFRQTTLGFLQRAYDDVELSRILIKSHKSGKTYGEQIRNKIMPSLISLQDSRRNLEYVDDENLNENLLPLKVSINYMIAYLSVLVEEFEDNYLSISNLQSYQDIVATKLRSVFTELKEGEYDDVFKSGKRDDIMNKLKDLLDQKEIPPSIEVVWEALDNLPYLSDFINELRDIKGRKSMYNQYFLQHYIHCKKILKTKGSGINKKLVNRKSFQENIQYLRMIEEKRASDNPITKKDNLVRLIMENELEYPFEPLE